MIRSSQLFPFLFCCHLSISLAFCFRFLRCLAYELESNVDVKPCHVENKRFTKSILSGEAKDACRKQKAQHIFHTYICQTYFGTLFWMLFSKLFCFQYPFRFMWKRDRYEMKVNVLKPFRFWKQEWTGKLQTSYDDATHKFWIKDNI